MSTFPQKTYTTGQIDPSIIKTMTGMEVTQAIIDGRLPQAKISQLLNFWLTEARDGWALFEAETFDELMNPIGTVHGGWGLTLIDGVCAAAAVTKLPAGAGHTTLETKCNFSRPILCTRQKIRAEGQVLSSGRRIIMCEAKIYDQETDKLLASGTSTIMVL